jgi:hypothetical protein
MSSEEKNHTLDAAQHASVDIENSVARAGVVANQPDNHIAEIISNHPDSDVVPAGPAGLSAPIEGLVSLGQPSDQSVAPPEQKPQNFGVLDPRRYVDMVKVKNSRRELKNAA